jgi:large repetitive protein
MKLQTPHVLSAAASIFLGAVLAACGGGGDSGQQPPPPPPPAPALSIATASILPGTLTDNAYSVTLQAVNGVGTLTWSIAPSSPTSLFVEGLAMDAHTGILSGTANFAGTAGFVATVKDSASPPRSATKGFYITASTPLQAPASQAIQVGQFADTFTSVSYSNGVQPFTFTVTGGTFPFGLRLNSETGSIRGSATVMGTYPFMVTIQDSYSPPEVVTTQINLEVIPPPLAIADSIPRQLLLNRSFSGRAFARGGTRPYHFALTSGTLPPGLSSLDANTGQISGTPTKLGYYFGSIKVTDSSSPHQTSETNFSIDVVNPIGRNDTLASATPIDNGMIQASISPYIDPPDSAPLAADHDYYKLVSLSGATVHIETQAQRWWPNVPLDTVIEILDAGDTRLTNCRLPGEVSDTFASACIDDDITVGQPTLDSALDLKVPGAPNTPTTFYVHVLDWRGDARPDMGYALQVSGVVAPLSISPTPLLAAARGLSYSQQLTSANGIGAVSWSIQSGSLPPGLTMDPSGAITGKPTTNGTYSFSVKATDSGTPSQTAIAQEQIRVVDPVKITSSATWPDACVNQSYSFAITTSGGLQPYQWSFYSSNWVGFALDQTTGVFSGVSSVTGTFKGSVGVFDATEHQDSQNIQVTVKNCS